MKITKLNEALAEVDRLNGRGNMNAALRILTEAVREFAAAVSYKGVDIDVPCPGHHVTPQSLNGTVLPDHDDTLDVMIADAESQSDVVQAIEDAQDRRAFAVDVGDLQAADPVSAPEASEIETKTDDEAPKAVRRRKKASEGDSE